MPAREWNLKMPLYEYECTACHRRTEKIQKFSDPELTVCPFCNGPLERTLTAPAVHFAGGGWYKDLYSSAKPPAASGEGKAGEAKPGDSGGSGNSKDGGAAAPAPASSGEGSSAPATAVAAPAAAAASSGSSGSPAKSD